MFLLCDVISFVPVVRAATFHLLGDTMKTNELKKGDWVVLANGWEAQIADNMKGNTRLATVYGFETEMGSVYAHDILAKISGRYGQPVAKIEYTPAQEKCRKFANSLSF